MRSADLEGGCHWVHVTTEARTGQRIVVQVDGELISAGLGERNERTVELEPLSTEPHTKEATRVNLAKQKFAIEGVV